MKLNINGGFRDSQGTYGGVFRDEKGQWLWGFTGKSTATNPLYAELLAIKKRIQALLAKGSHQVIVETDSSQTINLIHSYPQEDHPFLLIIKECKALLTNVWQSNASYVPRNFNKCTDVLANLGYVDQEELVWFDVIPPAVLQVLSDEIICS